MGDGVSPDGCKRGTLYTKHLEDGCAEWHLAPDSFLGMLRLFIYREVTGDSYRTLETYQELAEPFGLDHVPDEAVLPRACGIDSTMVSANT